MHKLYGEHSKSKTKPFDGISSSLNASHLPLWSILHLGENMFGGAYMYELNYVVYQISNVSGNCF